MKKSLIRKFLMVSAWLVLSAGVANAQSVYVGAGGGASKWNVEWTGGPTSDDSDTGYRAYVGYNFTEMWGAEVFYTDLGKTTGGPGSKVEATGFGAAGVFNLRFSDSGWRMFVRAGLANVETNGVGTVGANGKKDSVQGAFGVGFGYELTNNIVLRGDLDAVGIETADGKTTGVSLISLGFSIHF